jgi:cyclase
MALKYKVNKKYTRLIARLDVKGPNLIKGVHLEGLRTLGDPSEYAQKYYSQGVDEIIYMDIVASLYGRSNLVEIVSHTARNVFVPMTVGGGIRSVEDVKSLLDAGADKVAINTAAVKRPDLIREVSQCFGSQCMVISIEAKQRSKSNWEIYTDCGRERTGVDAIKWAEKAVQLGAGEILVTSIDREGTRKGFDVMLTRAISDVVGVPVIASGGFGNTDHLLEVVSLGGADAVAIADGLHYNRMSVVEIKSLCSGSQVEFRKT